MSAAQIGGLYAKVLAASRMITSVPKNGYNQHHKFHFATHDDVSDVCKTAMDKVGLALIPARVVAEDLGKLTRVTVSYILVDSETGESQEIVWHGDGQDTQDKALYKAITQCRKTLLLNLFLIPTGDREADGDHGHGYGDKSKGKPPERKPEPKPERFASLPKDRQDKARAKFWAIASALWGDESEVKAREFCKPILSADTNGKPSLTASTVPEVSDAIKALDKLQLAKLAATSPRN